MKKEVFKLFCLLVIVIFVLFNIVICSKAIEDLNTAEEENIQNIELVDEDTENKESKKNQITDSDTNIINNTNTTNINNDNTVSNTSTNANTDNTTGINSNLNTKVLTNTKSSIITTESSTPTVKYRTHVQNVGWQEFVQDGAISGTSGRSLRLEGINIKLSGLTGVNIKYQVHVQNIGWQDWKYDGDMAGTSGKSLRLEAIRIVLEDSDNYSVMYRVHVQNIGWQDWKYDGDMAGTSGQSLRLEAIEIKIVPKKIKGQIKIESPQNGLTFDSKNSVVEINGWKMANISNTYIKAYIDDIQVDSSKIYYYYHDAITYITDFGTQIQNQNAGFKFQIDRNSFKDGSHIIKLELYRENELITTNRSIFYIDTALHVKYRSHVQNIGWQNYVKDSEVSGTEGKSLRVEALDINLINAPENAKILYKAHVQNVGWQGWIDNGNLSGTVGQGLRIEALQIKLQNMDEYTVEYRAHIQGYGWSVWYIDGETAGTTGRNLRIEAIQIRIVPHYKKDYKGIDVSYSQGKINWAKVKNAGIDFAIIRCGYGKDDVSQDDKYFVQNILGCKSQNIPYGIYLYSYALNRESAYSEAEHVLRLLKSVEATPTFGVWIDIEDADGYKTRYGMPSNDVLVDIGQIFCDKLIKNGYTAGIYASLDWFNNRLNDSKLDKYEKWVAQWNDKCTYSKPYVLWQYSSKGNVDGINGYVDMDISYRKNI